MVGLGRSNNFRSQGALEIDDLDNAGDLMVAWDSYNI